MILTTDVEKAFDKIQQLTWLKKKKKTQQTRNRREIFQPDQGNLEPPQLTFHAGAKDWTLSTSSGEKRRMLDAITFI